MISCIIVDDEPRNVFILEKLVEQFCNELKVIGSATSPADAAALIRTKKPEVVFLDIEMPGKNAFDLLEELRPVNFEIVFVTAFDKYAVKAFRAGALDYLLKPVSIDDLRETEKRLKDKVHGRETNEHLENFLDIYRRNDLKHKVALQVKGGIEFYDADKILYCTAQGSYTSFHFSGNKKILTTGTLKSYEEILPEEFFVRIHHSCIVNLLHITSYTKGRGGSVTMSDGMQLDVSQRKKEEFLERVEKK